MYSLLVFLLLSFFPENFSKNQVFTVLWDSVSLLNQGEGKFKFDINGSSALIAYPKDGGLSAVIIDTSLSYTTKVLFTHGETGAGVSGFDVLYRNNRYFIPYGRVWEDVYPGGYEDFAQLIYYVVNEYGDILTGDILDYWQGGESMPASDAGAASVGETVLMVYANGAHGRSLKGYLTDIEGNALVDSLFYIAGPNPDDYSWYSITKTQVVADSEKYTVVWTMKRGYYDEKEELYYAFVTPDGVIVYPDGRFIGYIPEDKVQFSVAANENSTLILWYSDSGWVSTRIEYKKEEKSTYVKYLQGADYMNVVSIGDSFLTFWFDSTGHTCYAMYLDADGRPIYSSMVELFQNIDVSMYNLSVKRWVSDKFLLVYHVLLDGTWKIALRRVEFDTLTGAFTTIDATDFIPIHRFYSMYPAVSSYIGNNSYIVVWRDDSIYGRYTVKLGIWNPQQGLRRKGVLFDFSNFATPDIAKSSDGTYAVVWNTDRWYEDWDWWHGPDIEAVIIDTTGTIIKGFGIATDYPAYTAPKVATFKDKFIVSWQCVSDGGTSGYRLISKDTAYETHSLDFYPTGVASNGDKAIIVGKECIGVWDTAMDTIDLMIVDSSGNPVWDTVLYSFYTLGWPLVESDGNKFLIIYWAQHDSYEPKRIYGRFVYPDGYVGEEFLVADTMVQSDIQTYMVFDGYDYVVIWIYTFGTYIGSVRITTDGGVQDTEIDHDILPYFATSLQRWGRAHLTKGSYGEVFFMYPVYVSSYGGTEFHNVGYAGKIYQSLYIKENREKMWNSSQVFLEKNGMLTLPSMDAPFYLEIYDITGKLVYRNHFNGSRSIYRLPVSQLHISSGIYYYRLLHTRGRQFLGKFIYIKSKER